MWYEQMLHDNVYQLGYLLPIDRNEGSIGRQYFNSYWGLIEKLHSDCIAGPFGPTAAENPPESHIIQVLAKKACSISQLSMRSPLRSIVCLAASAVIICSTAQARPGVNHGVVKRQLGSFEGRYIDKMNYKFHNQTVKLIGYKKIKLSPAKIDTFEDLYFKHYAELQKSHAHFYDEASMELRIYFPVAGALVEHGGSMLEANELGEFDVDFVDGDYAVLGRKQTDDIRGAPGNIIKNGTIYLADKVYPTHQIGKVNVYDFGYKSLDHGHDHQLSERGVANTTAPQKAQCMTNHGGPNCSDKFNIYQGRCPRKHNVCMDYNGYITDCIKRSDDLDPVKILHFMGSDCYTALANSHCWNEIM